MKINATEWSHPPLERILLLGGPKAPDPLINMPLVAQLQQPWKWSWNHDVLLTLTSISHQICHFYSGDISSSTTMPLSNFIGLNAFSLPLPWWQVFVSFCFIILFRFVGFSPRFVSHIPDFKDCHLTQALSSWLLLLQQHVQIDYQYTQLVLISETTSWSISFLHRKGNIYNLHMWYTNDSGRSDISDGHIF